MINSTTPRLAVVVMEIVMVVSPWEERARELRNWWRGGEGDGSSAREGDGVRWVRKPMVRGGAATGG